MNIVVLIVERSERILLMKSNGRWALPGGMVCSNDFEVRCLGEKVSQSVGSGIRDDLEVLEGNFLGISPTLSCEIEAKVFVGDISADSCEIPEDKRDNVGWFGRSYALCLNLSDIARQALNCYFAKIQTEGV